MTAPTTTPSLPAAFSDQEIRRLKLSDRNMRRRQLPERINALGMGPVFADLYSLVFCDSQELVDGRLFFVEDIPDPADEEALIADFTAQFVAHLADTDVHGSADTGNQPSDNGGADSFTASDQAGALTQVNACRAGFEGHRVDVTGDPAIHTAADKTCKVLLDAAAAGDWVDRWVLLNRLVDCYAIHADNDNVHLQKDETNLVTASKVSASNTLRRLQGVYQWRADATDDPSDLEVVRHYGVDAALAGRFVRVDSRAQYAHMGAIAAPAQIIQYSGGSGAIDDDTGPWTLPNPRRSLQLVASNNDFQDCTFTVTFKDPEGVTVVETFALTGGATVDGRQIAEEILSVVSDVDPGGSDTVDINTGLAFGIGGRFSRLDLLSKTGTVEAAAQVDPVRGFIKPTTAPNGTLIQAVEVQR